MSSATTECVKCGLLNASIAAACSRCTWPFTVDSWSASTHTIQRITLDTGCINARGADHQLNQLEEWGKSGHLDLQRSDVMLKELRGEARIAKAQSLEEHPRLFMLGQSRLDGPNVIAGPDLTEVIAHILFPTARPMTENQRFDVEHLAMHVRTGGDLFITLNPNDFVTRGRQDELRSLGIWVLSPADATTLLGSLYPWARAAEPRVAG